MGDDVRRSALASLGEIALVPGGVYRDKRGVEWEHKGWLQVGNGPWCEGEK